MVSRRVWTILAGALLIRLVLLAGAWQDSARSFTPDSVGYWQLAGAMAEDGTFALDGAEIFRTPGYPAFLIPSRLISPSVGWRLALCVQVVLDVLLVYLTYCLGRRFLDENSACLAAALQAVAPGCPAPC